MELLLLGGVLLAWWAWKGQSSGASGQVAQGSLPGQGTVELTPPLTGVRWYPVEIGKLGMTSSTGDMSIVSSEPSPAGSTVYFAIEYGPTSERRLVTAMVNDAGTYGGRPAVIATATKDSGQLSLDRKTPAPIGSTFLVLREDLLNPKLAATIEKSQISI